MIYFSLFSMRLFSSHDSSHGFNKLTNNYKMRGFYCTPSPHETVFPRIVFFSLFVFFFSLCFFSFYFFNFNFILNTLSLLGIGLHYFLKFIFYKAILIWWAELWVWQVNLVDSSCIFFFLIDLFFKFYFSALCWLGNRFHDLFWFAFYKVIHVS
jgi:hypothetical protein